MGFIPAFAIMGAVVGAMCLAAYAQGMSASRPDTSVTKALRAPVRRRSRPLPPVPEVRARARANNRRRREARAQRAAPDRSELIATLRNLGYRAGDARSIAESVPADIAGTEGALAWVLSNTRRG